MQRIAVVGTTGSGKTTLARRLATTLDVPHVELDALQWGPEWTPADSDAFRADVRSALDAERWVVDGNYGAVRDLIWSRADTVVWLDYSVGTVLRRLIVRTFRRVVGREVLWNGNRERFWVQFASRDSLFLWMFRTHWRRRRTYAELLSSPEYRHLRAVRLDAPARTAAWLARIDVVDPARPPAMGAAGTPTPPNRPAPG